MNTLQLRLSSKTKDYYGLKLLLSLLILFLILASTSFYLIQNYYSGAFLTQNSQTNKIYFLRSHTLESMYTTNGMDYEEYNKRLTRFQEITTSYGYKPVEIYPEQIPTLKNNATLLALDMMALSDDEMALLVNFVQEGGALLFNYTAGFLNEDLKSNKNNLVTSITDLTTDSTLQAATFGNSTVYASTRLSSPLTSFCPKGMANDLPLYDPLPLFVTPKNKEADVYLTNWSQTRYPNITSEKELDKAHSGIVWHGYKGKGKWVYFSFPSYGFLDQGKTELLSLYKGILKYLKDPFTVRLNPYIDAKNAIFISEDTEYEFQNLEHFAAIAEKHNFPVTAFCVASLAQQHPQLMQKVGKSNYVEIGSHSYSHTQIVGKDDAVYKKETAGSKEILSKLTGQAVIGFRPPREEIDKKLINALINADYKYIFNEGENQLAPKFTTIKKALYNDEILIIPRHATDDYSYLVNLDLNASQILESMKQEAGVVSALNGLFTMSVHTHLMTFGSNINILDNFMAYVNKNKNMKPMNGKMIFKRILLRTHLNYNIRLSPNKIIITLSNDNTEEVKNLHIEIFHTPNVIITSAESEIIGTKLKLKRNHDNITQLIVNNLKPKSQMTLFLNYAKKN